MSSPPSGGDGYGSDSSLASSIPEIYLELASDPRTPNLGRGPNLEQNSALSKVNGSYNAEYQDQCNMEPNDSTFIRDPRGIFSVSACGNNIGPATPLVCPLAYEHSVHGLSFRDRGPSHLDWSFYPTFLTTPVGFVTSLNVREEAGDDSLIAIENRHLCTSIFQTGARTQHTQDPDNEPGAIDFSANGGEMLFDLNMEKVRPRKLKKKTVEERELYLSLRRRGGACEKHKLAKRKVSPPSSY